MRECEHNGECYKKTITGESIPFGYCKLTPNKNIEGEWEEIPKGYKVKERLYTSPMSREYIAICSTPRKDFTALLHFNGIEEHPTSIFTYWSKPQTAV